MSSMEGWIPLELTKGWFGLRHDLCDIIAAMWTYRVLAASLLSLAISPADQTQQARNWGTVLFPKNGEVLIQGIVKQGQPPYLVFHSRRTGQLVLSAQVGKNKSWKEFSDPWNPDDLDIDIHFLELHRPSLPDPLIVTLVRQQGISDCRFHSALFGEVNGKLAELTPELPDHWTRGQTSLSKQAAGDHPILTVTSERYQEKDVHNQGPGRMAEYVYTYDRLNGSFIQTRQAEIKTEDLQVKGDNLLALFGEYGRC